ncbi:MAG: TonB-dependent receptor [Holophagaceae bacterium]|nr:TonB-dependent receptor [Holophagaceae bacterium]
MTKRFNISSMTTLGLFLVASPALVSQVTTGQITGRVTDSDGRPISRATIVLTAPQLMGQRQIAADENGQWLAALLPPGDYTIRFSASGYVGTTVSNIRVGVGSQLRQDRVLRSVTAATETVDIVGSDTTIVDKADTRTATNVSADTLLQMTGGRDFATLIARTAGAGAGASGQPSVRGSSALSFSYRLNGAETYNPWANTPFSNAFMSDQIEDMAVVLSPTNARFGRVLSGGIDVVTRSGGNDFSGSVRVNVARGSWRGVAPAYNVAQTGLQQTMFSDAQSSRQRQLNLGGPIIKDRIWFSIGYILEPTTPSTPNYSVFPNSGERKRVMRTGHEGIDALTLTNLARLEDNRTIATPASTAYGVLLSGGYTFPQWPENSMRQNITRDYKHVTFKVTGAITQDHKLTVSGHRWGSDTFNEGSSWRPEQDSDSSHNDQTITFSYDAILGPSTFGSVKYSRAKGWSQWPHGEEGAGKYPTRYPLVTLYMDSYEGGRTTNTASFIGWNMGLEERNSESGGANLTMYRNFWDINHNIDVGIDYFQGDGRAGYINGEGNNSRSVGGLFENAQGDWLFPVIKWMGPDLFGQSSGTGSNGLAPWMSQNYSTVGVRKNRHLAYYFNDQMTINDHWNVMVGLRYDDNSVINLQGQTVLSSNHLSPRFVLTYDPKGDSSHVFKFNYMELQQEFHTGFTELFVDWDPRGRGISYAWTGNALPGGQPDPGTLGDFDPITGQEMYGLRFVTLNQLMDINNYIDNPRSFTSGFVRHSKADGLTPPKNTEFALEYRRNYGGGSYFRTAYAYRVLSNFMVARENYRPEEWVTLTSEQVAGQDLGLSTRYSRGTYWFNTNDLWRDYHGFEFETRTRINSYVNLTINYTFSQIRGNNEGGETTGAFNAGGGDVDVYSNNYWQTIALDALGYTENDYAPSGFLNSDRPHRLSANLHIVTPIKRGGWISYALDMTYTSGRGFSITRPASFGTYLTDIRDRYAAISTNDPTAPTVFDPPGTWNKYYSRRNAYHRNDDYSANLILGWEMPVWKKVKTMGTLNIQNVFNMNYYNYWYDTVDTAGYVNGATTNVVQWEANRFGRNRTAAGLQTQVALTERRFALSAGLKF